MPVRGCSATGTAAPAERIESHFAPRLRALELALIESRIASASAMPPLDFKAMMAAERAKAHGASVGESGSAPTADTAAAGASSAKQGVEAPELSWRLPREAPRPRFDDVHRVVSAPNTVWHVPDFVTAAEEEAMLKCAGRSPAERWTQLRGRRLQNLGGLPRAPPEGMTKEPLPGWVASICDGLVAAGVFPPEAPPNHVLLNEYHPGQGIDAHRDGPLYEPRVAILSLGSTCSFDFVSNDEAREPLCSLLLPRRGLLIFGDDAYHTHLHTVPALTSDAERPGLVRLDQPAQQQQAGQQQEATEAAAAAVPPSPMPRGRRISLTVRRVLHVQSEEQAAQPA